MAHHKRQTRNQRCRIAAASRRERLVPSSENTEDPAPRSEENESARRLGERFHSLPPELRDEIFAWLLVRPAKWAAPHRAGCAKLTTQPPHTESIRPQPMDPARRGDRPCASQLDGRGGVDAARWQAQRAAAGGRGDDDVSCWVDPWRSRWAPAITNAHVCSRCWDARLRPPARPSPLTPRSLPCLCARRRHLQVLLVCRQWYDKAGFVFYTRNVFAFGAPGECVDFLAGLAPRWARLVGRVSLRAVPADGEDVPETAEQELRDATVSPRGLQEAWRLLGRLPALQDLELDALYLTRPAVVEVFRRPGLPSCPRVRFTQNRPVDWGQRPEGSPPGEWRAQLREIRGLVWPSQYYREAVEETTFVRDVARGIQGRRHGWQKKHCRYDGREVARERQRYARRFRLDTSGDEAKDGGALS